MFGTMELHIPKELETLKLPDPGLLEYYALAKHRIFYLEDDICCGAIELQKAITLINIADAGKPVEERVPIMIYINSDGGDLSMSFTIAASIKISKTPVWTCNLGNASSGAFLVLISGHKRFAFENSEAMIHELSAGTGGTMTQIDERTKFLKKQQEKAKAHVLKHTQITEASFKKNVKKDWFLSDTEQVELGVVDRVVESIEEII